MNALVHYWTNGQWMPEYITRSRFPINEGNLQIRTGSMFEARSQLLNYKGALMPEEEFN